MRLKYFLRGVGIGILVTTIILTVTHSSERRMSDSEVIDRAIELGMSFSASHSGQQSSTEESSPEESSAGQENSGDDVTDDLQHESEAETEMGSQSLQRRLQNWRVMEKLHPEKNQRQLPR